jgi:hypothetical protein
MSFLFPRSPDLAFRAVVLPRRHLPKPPQDRSRLHDLAALLPLFRAQCLPRHGQPTTLIRGEREPTVAGERRDDLLENPDFLLRIVQLALHPLVDRARDHRDEKLERRSANLCQNSSDDFPDTKSAFVGPGNPLPTGRSVLREGRSRWRDVAS